MKSFSDFDKYLDALNEITDQENRAELEEFYMLHSETIHFFKTVGKSVQDILSTTVDDIILKQLETALPILTKLKKEITNLDSNNLSALYKNEIAQIIDYIKNKMSISEFNDDSDDTANQLFYLLKENKKQSIVEKEEKALKTQYDKLVQAKNRASTEKEYEDIVIYFKDLNYDNSEELVCECLYKFRILKECREEKENRDKENRDKYDKLVQAKNNVSTEKEFQDLAKQLYGMNGYENTTELANDCDNQYNVLKEKREQSERWAEQGLCRYCGGEMGGFFTKKCKNCGEAR